MKKILLWLLVIIPAIFVYKSFLVAGPLAWGDAPHFLPQEIVQLFAEPLSWASRGYNFGNINEALWLSPLMLLYGALNKFLGFGNDVIIRILFYFPGLLFAGIGSYFFAKYLKFSNTVRFFTVFQYTLNTYIILLIDGGQVGLILAYGVFPIALLFLKKLMDEVSLNNFFTALFFMFVLGATDPRLAIICLIALIAFQVAEFKIQSLKYLIPFTFCLFLLNLYWIYPLFKNLNGFSDVSAGASGLSFYYSFFLHSPNWPQNLFGQLAKPAIYFALVPILLFIGILFNHSGKTKAVGFSFFVCAIFTIGVPYIYKLPFGFAFRDTTKFFTPLMLFAGLLIGHSVESVKFLPLISKKTISLLVYIFLLFLILPAILGKLNFVLSSREQNPDIQKINNFLISDNSFYRSLWIPERYPTTYETNESPAADGMSLVKNLPFSLLNASEDQFNFLYNPKFVDTARRFGIKYLVLSDNPRELTKSTENQKNWDAIKKNVEENNDLEKVDLNTKVPLYKIQNSYPRFYAIKKLNGVIGPPLINSEQLPNSISFEDGLWDPHFLEGKSSESVSLVFNNSDKTDLAMSFLQKYFKSPDEASSKQWAVYTKDQYLKYKYELLIRGIKFDDLDYSKGMAFSTIKGEKMEYKFDVAEKGEYYLIVRSMIPSSGELNLKWNATLLNLDKGNYSHSFENTSDLKILNVVGLVPKKDYESALVLADTFVKYFKTTNKNDKSLLNESYEKVEIENPETLRYKFNIPAGNNWVIFNDTYNSLWKVKNGDGYDDGIPVYSMVNGFYVSSPNIEIDFLGQKNLRTGFYLSLLSILGLIAIYLYYSPTSKVK